MHLNATGIRTPGQGITATLGRDIWQAIRTPLAQQQGQILEIDLIVVIQIGPGKGITAQPIPQKIIEVVIPNPSIPVEVTGANMGR